MEHHDDIQAILEGDPQALRRLYDEHFPVIRSMIRAHGGRDADARDVLHDAVLVLYKKAQQTDFQLTSRLGTFLYSVCRNLWFNRRTKKSAFSEVTFSDEVKYMPEDFSLEQEILYAERSRLFWQAFNELGEDCQKILNLFFQKASMEIIAREMGFSSVGYAKRRKMQCKDKLIELVKSNPNYRELLDDSGEQTTFGYGKRATP